ncbi:MAG: hypothetical protein ACREXU_23315, partial [Gammaproteobacteria bacterium]
INDRVRRWLPHRIRNRWDQRRIEKALAPLQRTAPMASPDAASARAEVFMLLCRRDLWIGVLSIKSLLRYTDGQLATTIIDDGSLGPAGQAVVDAHLPGCRWLHASALPSATADPLRGRPRLTDLVLGGFVFGPKLVFPRAHAKAAKAVLLDADTVFFRRPAILVDWLGDERGGALYLHDHRRDDHDEAPAEVTRQFAKFHALIGSARHWSLPHLYFNAGLLAFEPQRLDFDIAEAYLEWSSEVPRALQSGEPGIWFGHWTIEQTAYRLMYGYLDPAPRSFGREYRLEEPGDSVFCHFLREGLMRDEAIRRLQGVVAELP